jgi:hypothetical protein
MQLASERVWIDGCLFITKRGNVGKGGAPTWQRQDHKAGPKERENERENEREKIESCSISVSLFTKKKGKNYLQNTNCFAAPYLEDSRRKERARGGKRIEPSLTVTHPWSVTDQRIKSIITIPISHPSWGVAPRCRLLVMLLPAHAIHKTRRRILIERKK